MITSYGKPGAFKIGLPPTEEFEIDE